MYSKSLRHAKEILIHMLIGHINKNIYKKILIKYYNFNINLN